MKVLETNEGTLDRAIRITLGIALLSLTVVGPQTLWGLVGPAASKARQTPVRDARVILEIAEQPTKK